MKDKVLYLLLTAEGYISGETMSEKLGISRTAVWKYINRLRSEGCIITSATNKGYKLISTPDRVDEQALRPHITAKNIAGKIVYFPETDSTNSEAKRHSYYPDGTLFIADTQTGGKGRLGRTWTSSKNVGIYMTLLLKPAIAPSSVAGITLTAGLAISRALDSFLPEDKKAMIKWPNDIVIDSKKISGTLTEMSAEIDRVNYVACGIGINVNNDGFDDELAQKAASLFSLTGEFQNRAPLAAAVINEFEPLYKTFIRHGLAPMMEEYRTRCITVGSDVRIIRDGAAVEAKAVDISDDGAVIAEINGERVTVSAGEVTVRGKNGYI